MSERHDVIVIGAGIHGLCAAYALRQRGREVLVLDRFPAGHQNGGSHGAGRITRSSYHDRRYVEMTKRMHRDSWPRLEAELGQQLVHRTPGLFFGPADGPFGAFLEATLVAGVDVEEIAREHAVERFPLLRFEPGDRVLLDHTAGVLAADRTLDGLREWLTSRGVELRYEVRVRQLHSTPDAVVLESDSCEWQAGHVVAATGAWLGELLPEWHPQLTPLRQEVGYVDVQAEASAIAVGTFPVWCRIGDATEGFEYGLPEFGRAGLKIALHRTQGDADEPNVAPPPIDQEALLARARRRFSMQVRGLNGTEHCLYSVAPDEHLHVAPAECDPRIIAVAACSGHGFKFGPVLGEKVADLIATR